MAYPTNPIYKLHKNLSGDIVSIKKQNKDYSLHIPFDEANADYQEYLLWKAIDGNEPEAAD